MRNPLSDKVIDIKPSGIRKFFDLVVEMNDPNVISLGVGEPDFDTPWHIREEGISGKRSYILYIQCRIEGIEGRNQCLSGTQMPC